MAFQAYVDDSMGANGTFVLAGHVATAENWARLSDEWQRLLPLTKMNPSSTVKRFKFAEMSGIPERWADTAAFFRLIEKYVIFSFSYQFNRHDLKRARERTYLVNGTIDFDLFNNDYFVAFRGVLDTFQAHRAELAKALPENDPVDFIFDNQEKEKSKILAMWDDYMASRTPVIRQRFGAAPRFEDDERVMPLQAADLWAGAIRMWTEQGVNLEKLESLDFGPWVSNRRDNVRYTVIVDEDQMTDNFIRTARENAAPGLLIFDLKWLLPRLIEGY